VNGTIHFKPGLRFLANQKHRFIVKPGLKAIVPFALKIVIPRSNKCIRSPLVSYLMFMLQRLLVSLDSLSEPVIVNPFDHIDPDKVPEAISKGVASLPPEQMFELMKQMKQCIQNNPSEARTMLLQNPQLAYGLLQAMVVMKIVDPEVALVRINIIIKILELYERK